MRDGFTDVMASLEVSVVAQPENKKAIETRIYLNAFMSLLSHNAGSKLLA